MIVRPGLTFNGEKLFEHVIRDLPAYARPLFIRLQVSRDMLAYCICVLILLMSVLCYEDYSGIQDRTVNS